MDPIIQWVGGKKRLLHVLDLMLPNNYNTYYEPFLGGGLYYITYYHKIENI